MILRRRRIFIAEIFPEWSQYYPMVMTHKYITGQPPRREVGKDMLGMEGGM